MHVLLPRGCLPLQFAVARKPTLAISIEHIFHWNRNRSYTREWRDEHSTQLDHCDGKILHWYITCCANLRPTIWWWKHYLLPFPLIAGEDDYLAYFPARNGILFLELQCTIILGSLSFKCLLTVILSIAWQIRLVVLWKNLWCLISQAAISWNHRLVRLLACPPHC